MDNTRERIDAMIEELDITCQERDAAIAERDAAEAKASQHWSEVERLDAKLATAEAERDALRDDNIRIAGILGKVMRERDLTRKHVLELHVERDALREELAALRAIASGALAYSSPLSYDMGTEDYEQVYRQALEVISATLDA